MKRCKYLIWLLLGLLAGLSSCTHRPAGVLSSRKMTAVLVKLHVADGVLQQMGYNYGHDQQAQYCYQSVLASEGVTQAQFDSSLVWYTDNPLRFNRVYTKVLKQLKREGEAYMSVELGFGYRSYPELDRRWQRFGHPLLNAPWPPKAAEKPVALPYFRPEWQKNDSIAL